MDKLAKKNKKNRKELVSFEKLKAFRKIFSAFFSIVIIFDVFTHIIVRAQTVSESLKDSTEKLAQSKVIEEQIEHFVMMRSQVRECEQTALDVEQFMVDIEQNGFLDSDQKMDLAIELKAMEENAFSLEYNFDEYYADASIQYNSQANSNVSNYFYETAFLKTALERFIRRSEQQLLFGSPDPVARDILQEDYYDVLWQIGHLKEIEQELKIFEKLK